MNKFAVIILKKYMIGCFAFKMALQLISQNLIIPYITQ
jgi:hypothetical protein